MSTKRTMPERLAVYRCRGEQTKGWRGPAACGLYDAAEGAMPAFKTPNTLFGDDQNYDECSHTWPLDFAEALVRMWNERAEH